ncbi:hypothetical protein L596_019891 [Steinernema carpocapsae]|uniref:Uncharacterized protein n=1 Tax=Steinernema carpocapsae TaxID=34508 RepID=A0A4U5MSI4_STECR|nr:hypothetical protein L596_019891 [Steinernema carpocapsae]
MIVFCCKQCQKYILDETSGESKTSTLLLAGARLFASLEDDNAVQTLGYFNASQSCENLQGYAESRRSGGCLFHVSRWKLYSGSTISAPPLRLPLMTKTSYDICEEELTMEDYRLTCYCATASGSCAYSKKFHASAAKFHERFLAEKESIKDLTALGFYHRSEEGTRKFHCAYGHITESKFGLFNAMRKGRPLFEGLNIKRLFERAEDREPKSMCSIKVIFAPVPEKGPYYYNISIEMGSDSELREATNDWAILEPNCSARIPPGERVIMYKTCSSGDACNHFANKGHIPIDTYHKMLAEDLNITLNDTIGLNLNWAKECEFTVEIFRNFIDRPDAELCQFHYDIEHKKRIFLGEQAENVEEGNKAVRWKHEFKSKDGAYQCSRTTKVLTRSCMSRCPEGIDIFDSTDSPLRDVVTCGYNAAINSTSPTAEDLEKMFEETIEMNPFRCAEGDMRFADFRTRVWDDESIVDTAIPACGILLYRDEDEYVLASYTVDADESLLEFYHEHFVSHKSVQGIAYSYDSNMEMVVLICTLESMCNTKEFLAEMMLPIYHMNNIHPQDIHQQKCGQEACGSNEGCYEVFNLKDQSSVKKGCISSVASNKDLFHVQTCIKTTKQMKETCYLVQRLEEGVPEYYKVCCDYARYVKTQE